MDKECQSFLSILSVISEPEIKVNRFYYFTLLQEADRLESFLDDYGSRSNLRWLYFAELVACVRNFSLAIFHLYHALDRYSDYLGAGHDNVRKEFESHAFDILDYFSDFLRRFHKTLVAEARTQGIKIKLAPIQKESWKVKVTPQLPYTISNYESADESERIISVAQAYRRARKGFREHGLHKRIRADNLAQIIPGKINETLMAEFESALHNIQSEYDTHIRGGKTEKQNQWMITLRGLTAIPMHLIEFIRWLVHFYERHENQVRQSDVKARISGLVDDERLMDCICGFALRYCNRYLNEGNEVAERILSMYVEPITYELPLPKPQGFHARPATYVSLVIQEHGTDAFLLVDGKKFNCRSVLDLLEAGGILADLGMETVTVEGDKRSLDDLKILAQNNYCEDREIPKELSYLRISRNL